MNKMQLFQISLAIMLGNVVTTRSPQYVQAQADSVRKESAYKQRRVLPLSTCVSESVLKRIIVTRETSVHWKNNEYGIDDGVDVLMSVITDPTVDVETRSTAINRLGHFSTRLQGRECLQKLCMLYDGLRSRMEKREVLKCLTIAEDSTGLSLLYRVATTESDPILRFQGAAGLAAWNIREGVHQLIELFQSSVNTGLRDVGAAAMISFTSLNERKEWNCPQDEIRLAALAASENDGEKYAKAAMRAYRDWFEANKNRFPDWKIGDPLPEAAQEASEDPLEK